MGANRGADDRAKGASMSSKQLARTVLHGRLLTFRLLTGDSITGYLCGMDDFHWMVVTGEGQKHLIHKASAGLITLADTASFEEEPLRDELEKIVGPFREFVQRSFFGRNTASPPASERAAV